jgi:proteasome component ECM29
LLNPSIDNSEEFLPAWDDLVKGFFTGSSILHGSHAANIMMSGMELDGVSAFGNFSGTKINAFPAAVNYCRRMLLMGALQGTQSALTIDADWERQLDVLFRSDLASRSIMKAHLKTVDEGTLVTYLTAAFEGMRYHDGNGLEDCGKCFVEVGSLAPSSVIAKLAPRARELIPSITCNKPATRFIAAQAFGILAGHPINDQESVSETASSLLATTDSWSTAVGSIANQAHGAILALGHLLSRAAFYGREDIDGISGKVRIRLLEICLATKDASTKEAVFNAIGQLGISDILNIDTIAQSGFETTKVIDVLAVEAKTGLEVAMKAIGRLGMTFPEAAEENNTDYLQKTLKILYDLHELRQPEVHFTIGEALSCTAGGWDSEALKLSLDVDTTYVGTRAKSQTLKGLMEKLLADCKTTKPSLKKASGIWLFSLVQHCGQLPEVQARLRECQAAFMSLLSAREDIVQETASRGLSLVYEQGDKELKERLVNDLVASFTGTSTKLKVDEDTELFEPGALPTGEGQSVTSYKDIMSLAAEVGDQSLVYKFMSLASNAATWSTRAAFGRFGLSSILSESEIDPKLYPKLYRYRFDPNSNVQRSMNDIWSALVKDSSTTIDKYFDDIMEDLLKSILGKEWRTRQASCAAIAELVQGRQFEKYSKYLEQIFSVAFKVLDDIKGSVRLAAMKLCKVLTGILVRQLETGAGVTSKNAQTMLKNVLPFLLSTQGIENSAKDVQIFSLDAILKIVKKGGRFLRPAKDPTKC